MRKASCWIMSFLFLFSIFPCSIVSAKESILSPHGYEMSKKLNIDNPDEYWTKEWLELDADQDGYLSKDEVKEAYPKHGADAFQYMDQNGDGWVSMAEWYEIYK